MSAPEGTNPLEDWIGSWLEYEHRGYIVDRVVEGSYGRVWILKNSSPNVYPPGIAAKSFRQRPDESGSGLDIEMLFEREIALWMRVPPHVNVLSALGIDLVPSLRQHGKSSQRIPVVVMPLFDGSLRDWIGRSDRPDDANCLVIVAQLCNGLGWLYSHGVSGHGDLKPENVLYKDLRGQLRLVDEDHSVPSRRFPWRVAVSDLGWANAWSALGLSDRAWRPYLAPERTEAGFDARRSDSFAVGVILSELLTGLHPAGEPADRIAKWKRQRWLDWAKNGVRKLAFIADNPLRSVIDRCLSPIPGDRPDPVEIVAEIASYAEDRYQIPLKWWFDALNHDAAQKEFMHPGWANEQIAEVSKRLHQEALQDLRERLKGSSADSPPESRAATIWLVRSLTTLLSRGDTPAEWHEGYDLAAQTCHSILDAFHTLDLREAMVYAPEEMTRQEILLSVLNELVDFLSRVGGSDLPEVIAIRAQIGTLVDED